jgi:hypothetical protein
MFMTDRPGQVDRVLTAGTPSCLILPEASGKWPTAHCRNLGPAQGTSAIVFESVEYVQRLLALADQAGDEHVQRIGGALSAAVSNGTRMGDPRSLETLLLGNAERLGWVLIGAEQGAG